MAAAAAAEFICREKNIHVYINVKDRRAARKNNPLWQYEFEPNIRALYKSIHTTYPANVIKAADMVKQIQQFKL